MRDQREKDGGGYRNNKRHGDNRKGGYQEATKEDAEKMGFNFSKGGPPRF